MIPSRSHVAGVALAAALACHATSPAREDGTTESQAPAVRDIDEEALLAELLERLRSNPSESMLLWPVEDRRVAFKNLEALAPSRPVRAGAEPYPLESYPLEEAPLDLGGLTYTVGTRQATLTDFTERAATIGIVVVQDDAILFERYAPGNDAATRWITFSVTKSVTSMLIGAAIQDGFIGSVDDDVTRYLPQLKDTAYDGATLKHVLQMSSGVGWDEDYADPRSDVSRAGAANGQELLTHLAGLERVAPAGEVFNYNTGETNLAGDILRAAIEGDASTYLSEKVWSAFGMEADASWLLGASGGETGGCCLSVTLRDMARIGLFALNDGRLRDGTRVLPEGWMKASTTAADTAGYYGYLWWLNGDESFYARGIFGQHILIDPENDLVIAIQSNGESAVQSAQDAHIRGVVQALRDALAKG